MVKCPCNALPVVEVVALGAIRTQPSLMGILVAARASPRETYKTPSQVLHLDQGSLACGNVLRAMALPAFEAGVLSFQRIPRLFMIEALRVPLDDGEVEPVVVGVAPGALLAGSRAKAIGEMQASMSGESGSNLGVAFQAFEGSFSARQLVAGGTVRSALEVCVCASQRPRGNLRSGKSCQRHQGQGQQRRARSHGSRLGCK